MELNDAGRSLRYGGLTRRDVLRGAAAGAVILGVPSSLAACGGDDDAPDRARRVGGTLRVGVGSGFGASATLDPDRFSGAQPDQAALISLFDRLTVRDANFDVKLSLAEELEPNATADEWTIRIRPDVELHDGRTLDADDLVASFRRKLEEGTTTAGNMPFLDPKRMRKLDQRTVRLTFLQPYAPFPEILSRYQGFITPAGFDPKQPVGTGPFAFRSFTPGQRTVLERYPNYWGEGPFVERLVLSEINDETARVNALLSGQLEAIASVPTNQLRVVEGTQGLELLTSETGALRPLVMDTRNKPFDDVRVRQAVRLMADREQMLELALAGRGKLGNDVFGPLDACYDDAGLPQRERDTEQAQSLLRQAGQEGLSLELFTSDVAPGLVQGSEVFAQNAKDAGVDVRLRKIPASSYFTSTWTQVPFFVTYGATSPYLEYAAIATLSSATVPETLFDNRRYDRLYREAVAALDEQRRCELVAEMMRIDYEQGGYLIWAFPNFEDAYSDQVTGFAPVKGWMPLTNFEFNRVSFV